MTTEAVTEGHVRYAGFWIRFLAVVIDTAILSVLMAGVMVVVGMNTFMAYAMTGWTSFFINWVLPLLISILFWRYKGGTPGKMALSMIIVDADTLSRPSWGQLLIRYFAYLVSTLPLCLGFLWIAWDAKKQSFHDKLARTVVILN